MTHAGTDAARTPVPRRAVGPRATGAPRWAHALLWAGAAACVAGIVATRLWEQWRPGRFAELLVLAACAGGLAWLVRRISSVSWATALVVVQLAALAVFAGSLPVVAALLLALAAIAIGGAAAGSRAPAALQCACGLALVGGVLGWLLPLPLHLRWVYVAGCLGAIAWRRAALRQALADLRVTWRSAIAADPRAAAWAVVALGLAATACWLPTLQVDDLGYHLRLPSALAQRGAYAPDPWHHAWAVAPWASDVQHAVVQVMAGREARGALDALWVALAASAVWHLARTLGGSPRAAWTSVALYASLPMTAALAAGMQTETAAAALLAWLAWLVLARGERCTARGLVAGAALFGGLAGLKLMAAAQAVLLAAWAAWRERRATAWRWLPACALMALVVAGSSYAYGAAIAGNPFLPLFNATFGSPYFAASDFDDARWHAGWSALLPWRLTFDTARYHEGFAGAAGFVLVALSGAWILALFDRRTRGFALASAAMLALTLLPLQYLRYAFPALVLLVPCVVVAAARLGPGALRLVVATCVLNLAFQANAHWMLRTGAVKQAVRALGADGPLFAQYAPERALLARLRNTRHGTVLALDAGRPWIAELGQQARSLAWYDPRMQRDALAADNDPTGVAWVGILRTHRITDLLVHEPAGTAARRAALRLVGARRVASVGAVAWWRVAEPARP